MLEPKEGLLTFRAEGNNLKSSTDYSKKLHWPGNASSCGKNNSGVTIGRGFDLGDKSKISVLMALKNVGIENDKAEAIASGARLKGCSAYNFVLKNRDRIEEITEQQQLNLFLDTYKKMKKDAERICKDKFTIEKYHPDPKTSPELAWDNIPQKIKEVLIDLRYRGDYSLVTRSYIQRLAYAGDVTGFGKVVADRSI